jgi:hypothetical protein
MTRGGQKGAWGGGVRALFNATGARPASSVKAKAVFEDAVERNVVWWLLINNPVEKMQPEAVAPPEENREEREACNEAGKEEYELYKASVHKNAAVPDNGDEFCTDDIAVRHTHNTQHTAYNIQHTTHNIHTHTHSTHRLPCCGL